MQKAVLVHAGRSGFRDPGGTYDSSEAPSPRLGGRVRRVVLPLAGESATRRRRRRMEAHVAASPIAAAAAPEACGLVPIAEIERLIGPIEGRPKPEEKGCWYSALADAPKPEAGKAGGATFDHDRLMPFEDPRRGLLVEVDLVATPLASGTGEGKGAGTPSARPGPVAVHRPRRPRHRERRSETGLAFLSTRWRRWRPGCATAFRIGRSPTPTPALPLLSLRITTPAAFSALPKRRRCSGSWPPLRTGLTRVRR